jgi:hypothetical protein
LSQYLHPVYLRQIPPINHLCPRRIKPPIWYHQHPVSFLSVFVQWQILVISRVHMHHYRLHNLSHRLHQIHRHVCPSAATDMAVEIFLHQVTFELLLN